jgi:hypothetical protein
MIRRQVSSPSRRPNYESWKPCVFFGGKMTRLKLLINAAVSLLALYILLSGDLLAVSDKTQPAQPFATANDTVGLYKSGGGFAGEIIPADSVPAVLKAGNQTEIPGENPSCPPFPYFINFIEHDTVYFCLGHPFLDTIVAADSNSSQTLFLTMLSGPGDFSSTPSTPPAYGYYSYSPEFEGSFDVTFMVKNSNGDSAIAAKTYYAFVNFAPQIVTRDTSVFRCLGGGCLIVDVDAVDPENDPLIFTLLAGEGTIEATTGRLKFSAENAGVYCFTVLVSDGCSDDTADICITVVDNTLPVFINEDKRFVLCTPDTICFTVFATDPDIGDSLVITEISGPGDFIMSSDSTGTTCFLPADVDSADYVFVYEVTDKCLRGEWFKEGSCPPVPRDTIVVTVIIGDMAVLDCPGDTSIFICEPDTLCFYIGDIPDEATVSIFPPSAWFNHLDKTICFYTNCTVHKELKAVVESVCGADSCMFDVDVTMNSSPVVMLSPDTVIKSCGPGEVCIPIGITDIDNNILDIAVLPDGYYNELSGKICFSPGGAGDYTLTVSVTDSCGAVTTDSVAVEIKLNSAPIVNAGADTAVSLCDPEDICLPVIISDPDRNWFHLDVDAPFRLVSWEDSLAVFCLTPGSSGKYTLAVEAIDSCFEKGADSAVLTVTINGPPTVQTISDSTVFLCEPEMVCFPAAVSDPDDDIAAIHVNGGAQYINGFVCFTPSASGAYEFIIDATDSCGHTASDTALIHVIINSPPMVVSADDSVCSICGNDSVCIDVLVSDPDNNIQTVATNIGQYDSEFGRVCFQPGGPGIYQIITTVTDSCYLSRADTTSVTVVWGEAAQIQCPQEVIDTFLCGPQTICFPVFISPSDAFVSSSYGVFQEDSLCFLADTAGIYDIELIAEAECGADTCHLVFDVTVAAAVEIECPDDTALLLCGPGAVEIPLRVEPFDAHVIVAPFGTYDPESKTLHFNIADAGHYAFVVTADDGCSFDTCRFSIEVTFNQPPVITARDTSFFTCEIGGVYSYEVQAVNPEPDDPVTFRLLSVFGEIDALSGIITFAPDTAGDYCFEVEARDGCGAADTAVICVGILLNSAPVVVSADDTLITLCEFGLICLPVSIHDDDDNIVLISPNIGQFSDGFVCFTPEYEGEYLLITSAHDSCGAVGEDTTVVNVKLVGPFVLDCPGDTSVFICNPDTVCIPFVNIPENAAVTVLPPSAWYDDKKESICFYTNCSVEKRLKIIASNPCVSDTCAFTVHVTMNSNPLVILPPDTSVTACGPREICIPVGISDVDGNLFRITVSPDAYYDSLTGKVCFTAYYSNVYNLKVRAVDSCGAAAMDSIMVSVKMNEAPQVSSAPDFGVFQCNADQICFPVEISDVDGNIREVNVSPFGVYDAAGRRVCFTPPGSGIFKLIITAIDSCGAIGADTTAVDVSLNAAPVVDAGPDTTVVTCERTRICVPVMVSDADHNLATISVTGAEYEDGFICFTPAHEGTFKLIVTAIDSCNAKGVDTAVVHVVRDHSPVVISPDSVGVFLCTLENVCFGVDISDPENNIKNIYTNIGSYNPVSGEVCFKPNMPGIYRVITTAIDDCDSLAADTTMVNVVLGQEARINCPTGPVHYYLCAPQTISYNLLISPADAVVSASYGIYEAGRLVFYADTSGTYSILVTADASCGPDTCLIEFVIEIGEPAHITCPNDTSVFLCGPGQVCLPVIVGPQNALVNAYPIGEYENSHICFNADTSGTYHITLTAWNDCGSDTCSFDAAVIFNAPPVVNAGNDTGYFVCEFAEICRKVEVTDPDNGIDSVVIKPYGYYDGDAGALCFTPADTGVSCFVITAYDECGAAATDSVCFTISTGAVAVIDCPVQPFNFEICNPGQICVPLHVHPETAEVKVSYGVFVNNQICFYADTSGSYRISVIASELCGADTCFVIANVVLNEYVDITCPLLPIAASLCDADSVSVLLPISTTQAAITILPHGSYNFADSTLSFFADTSGHYRITVIAQTPCNADTCLVEADVTITVPPQLICRDDFDTLVCLQEVSEICFDLEVIGSGFTVTVLPDGYYSGGMVCIPVSEAGIHNVRVIASSLCGADTCDVAIEVTPDLPPQLTVPEDQMIPWCENDTGQICISGISAIDPEDDDIIITKVQGPGVFIPDGHDGGRVCFHPDRVDTTYEFHLEASDGCSVDHKSFLVTVFPSAVCSVCVDVAIETDSCYMVGSLVPVRIMVRAEDPIGGFDLLVGFDKSVLILWTARRGDAIEGWEYFTYRYLDDESCGSGCPSGLIRFVGIADENNGAHHPPQDQLSPDGVLAVLTLRIINDLNIGGQYLPINFYWQDCGDNTFSDPSGELLYVDARIYNSFGGVYWDESDNNLFPELARPTGLGAPDSCLVGGVHAPVRCIYLHNGAICVKHPDSVDARGDVNLNGVPYEIADAVVFTNFFIYGLAAFAVNVEGQVAATDVNADGYMLTISDLVYLIRIIIGDANIIPRLSPGLSEVELTVDDNAGTVSVRANSNCYLGAGLLIFEYDGVSPELPTLGDLAEGMSVLYAISGSEIRVLIYSFESGRAVNPGDGCLVNIAYRGKGNISLAEASFATFHGENVDISMNSPLVPERFIVSQNYPNPFNPVTSIDLSLPFSCNWKMTVYNINGQIVKCLDGKSEPGTITITWDGKNDRGQSVASGVYFYRVEAGDYSVTRKMTLLK